MQLHTRSESDWRFDLEYVLFIGNVIIPTDELIFFRKVGSTTNQISWKVWKFTIFKGQIH